MERRYALLIRSLGAAAFAVHEEAVLDHDDTRG